MPPPPGLSPTDGSRRERHSEAGSAKRHFVEVSFADGRYVVRARQHDGSTGLASPVVRRTWTSDRQFVARAAALLIDQDFGVVGTVVPGKSEGQMVQLALKGGGFLG